MRDRNRLRMERKKYLFIPHKFYAVTSTLVGLDRVQCKNSVDNFEIVRKVKEIVTQCYPLDLLQLNKKKYLLFLNCSHILLVTKKKNLRARVINHTSHITRH